MEESEEILLRSLAEAGVSFQNYVSSIRDLTPANLVSICAQCLNLVDETASLPTSLPDFMVDQFKICTDIALAVKRLGYVGEMSYYKLLYPSEEDLYKLVRFLVERLSKSSIGVKTTDAMDINAGKKIKDDNCEKDLEGGIEKDDIEGLNLTNHKEKLKNLSLHEGETEFLDSEVVDPSSTWLSTTNFSKDEPTDVMSEDLFPKEGKTERSVMHHEERTAEEDGMHVQKMTLHRDQLSKVRCDIEELKNQEKVLMEKVNMKTSELQCLEEEFELLKEVTEMAFDDQHPVHFYVDQLSEQVDARNHNVEELGLQWDAFRRPLEEKRRFLEESLYVDMPEAREILQKLREVELEKESVFSEIKRREVEHSKLLADFEKQPRVLSRASYVERIKEITKNSWKQDADVERILKETRELQLESNSIQERLHRTYAVLDEIVFREAKKDLVGRQAYRLLTTLHENFEQIFEKILTKDRVQREVADYKKKLAATASRGLDVDKLQADLDAIIGENERLEQQLKDKLNG